MTEKANPTIIGAFVVGAVALVIVVFLMFGSGRFFADTYQYVIYFQGDANGLIVGAPVKIRGVAFGKVLDINPIVDEEGDFYIEVVIETDAEAVRSIGEFERIQDQGEQLEKLIRHGIRAQLAVESMVTGLQYVVIDYFPDSEDTRTHFNDEYLEIPSVASSGEMIQASIKKTITSVGNMEFEEISRSMVATLRGLDSLLRSPRLHGAIGAAEQVLVTTDDVIRGLDDNISSMSGSFTTTSMNIDSSLTQLNELLEELEEMSEQQNYELLKTLREMKATTRAFRILAEQLELKPESMLRGK